MKLGHAFEFDITVADVPRSTAFYESLGLRRVESPPAADVTRLTDGLIVIALRRGNEGTGLTYFSEDLGPVIDGLRQVRATPDVDQRVGRAASVRFIDPTGLRVSVVQRPRGDTPAVAGQPISRLGQFGELSLEAANVGRTAEFWRGLGYEPTQ